jgi:hypothetical protein
MDQSSPQPINADWIRAASLIDEAVDRLRQAALLVEPSKHCFPWITLSENLPKVAVELRNGNVRQAAALSALLLDRSAAGRLLSALPEDEGRRQAALEQRRQSTKKAAQQHKENAENRRKEQAKQEAANYLQKMAPSPQGSEPISGTVVASEPQSQAGHK